MPGSRRSFLAAFAFALVAGTAVAQPPQVSVDAGRNQKLDFPKRMTRLTGSVTNLTPLDFWVADGDHATHDHRGGTDGDADGQRGRAAVVAVLID